MLRKPCLFFTLCCAVVLAKVTNETNIPIQPVTVEPKPPPTTSTTTPATPTNATTPTTTTTTTTTSSTPTTSTSPTPTTESPTTTLAPPSRSHYAIKDGNDTCIIADLAVQVKLSIDNKTWEFDVPANSSFSGTCNNKTQDLILSWEDKENKSLVLTFQFAKDETAMKFVVSEISLTIPQLNSTLNLTEKKPMFPTTVSKSYKCEKEQEIKLGEEGTNKTFAVLKISNLQLEAFHTTEDEKFSAAEDCASASSPDIVPIAVGCALVGLIVIVLVAYLVGRRRSQARGYLSM